GGDGGAHHAHPDGHRGRLPDGAQPASEQGERVPDAARRALRARAGAARSGAREAGVHEDGHRLGQPDPFVRVPAVHAGDGSSHGAEGGRCAARDERRHRPVHRGIPEGARGARGMSGGVTAEKGSQVLATRLEKREERRRRGIEPYAYSYDVTHHTTEAVKLFTDAEAAGTLDEAGEAGVVRVGGRLTGMRQHGKVIFADLADREGRIQLYFRANDLGADAFELLDLLDPGDWL